jgi:hypothetical protein
LLYILKLAICEKLQLACEWGFPCDVESQLANLGISNPLAALWPILNWIVSLNG